MSDTIVYRCDYRIADQAVQLLARHHIPAAIANPPSINHRYRYALAYPVAVAVPEADAERAASALREWESTQPAAVRRHLRILYGQGIRALGAPLLWLGTGLAHPAVPIPNVAGFGLAWLLSFVVIAQLDERRLRSGRAG